MVLGAYAAWERLSLSVGQLVEPVPEAGSVPAVDLLSERRDLSLTVEGDQVSDHTPGDDPGLTDPPQVDEGVHWVGQVTRIIDVFHSSPFI